MAHEVTVPLLPCPSIDDITAFYRVLGFEPTHRQQRPNPYVALRREDLELHFFGLPDFQPENSYGTCLVAVPDVAELYAAFAQGMRAAYGKVPAAGIPRMTRPRPKKNMAGVTGFSVVDPGGNWIRITAKPGSAPAPGAAATSRLATSLQNAVVQGDSRGNPQQAAKILDGALSRPDAAEDPAAYVEALIYRAELATALADPAAARSFLGRAEEAAAALDPEARRRLAPTLEIANELRE